MNSNIIKALKLIILSVMISISVQSQDRKLDLKDTLDNKLDLSQYVVNLHGFVPYPVIISEPALGNFGGALALVFIARKRIPKILTSFIFLM